MLANAECAEVEMVLWVRTEAHFAARSHADGFFPPAPIDGPRLATARPPLRLHWPMCPHRRGLTSPPAQGHRPPLATLL